MKLIDMGTAESNLGRDCPGYEAKMGCDVCGYYGVEDEFSGDGLCAECAESLYCRNGEGL